MQRLAWMLTWPAALAAASGLLLGLRWQLYYLSAVAWQAPAWRLAGGALAGLAVALALWAGLKALLTWITGQARDNAGRLSAAALAITALAGWFFWPQLAHREAIYLLGIMLLAMVGLGAFLQGAMAQPAAAGPALARWLLAAVLLGGLALRLAGIQHGLPELIAHCDTPKQLDKISQFFRGELVPPNSYPLGHIYLYTALLKAASLLLGLELTLPDLSPETIAQCSQVIVAARAMQAMLGAALAGLAYLVARRLWDRWTGLMAALLVACDPLHLTYSWQVMGEVPQTFWVLLALWAAARIMQGGGLGDYLLAGLAAGLAVATKLYGGYVLVAVMAGHLLGGRDRHRRLLAALAALLAGAALATPYVWLNPAGWWANLWAETTAQYTASGEGSLGQGLAYLIEALAHRFSWAWLAAGILSLGFLAWRHAKADLFLLAPAACALAIVLVFRLSYLREWDLVNLTPYLALALAAASRQLWQGLEGRPLARAAAGLALAALLGHLGLAALSEAWLARQPDTRQQARAWLGRQVPAGGKLLADLGFSHAYAMWPENLPGVRLALTHYLDERLAQDQGQTPLTHPALALERVWWQPPMREKLLRPVQVFKLRNSYWEHPEIRLYLREVPEHRPQVLLPHLRVAPAGSAFWYTPWARRQVVDLLYEPERRAAQVHASEALEGLAYLALGQGRASLFFGPWLGRPLAADKGRLSAGFCAPLRAPLPVDPPTYRFSLGQGKDVQALWVGLYDRPELMLPLLARYGQWEMMERALARQTGAPAAEALLWLAAAQAGQGREEAAAASLARLQADHPDFIAQYARLAGQEQAAAVAGLGRLATATAQMLLSEGLCWSRREGCPPGQGLAAIPEPLVQAKADGCHLWLDQAFLPGFLKLRLELGQAGGQPGLARPAKLAVLGHYPGYESRRLADMDLATGQGHLEMDLEIPSGPLRLELILEDGQGGGPRVEGLRVSPDLAAEFAWRWRLLNEKLPALAGLGQAGG